ncbi:hypothetical protein EMIHUDRAFT_229626 [Emiliania huxleyi CCMP1516]|uniref:Uncharacterized protein n=2 Tax=Emiliania huxleyi TaxID=2903 RepID=A0A0D3KCK8_EMIH1|nr:hypothetical protein EMIHUDRAFT_229626 [Emiliania huxleyi CCMP1516]EOD33493.1 hypothetical protein EMIHUDRAFT_229626 [Emiliania huxleyi CCMP1516]|eukprot:XP_005785922.1 hypothetical protein EMIHUDRAFT_229626 [Emiliania huxleyi CCMP1516]
MAEPRARLLSLATLHEPHPFGQHASICPPNRAALLLWSAQAVPLASAISKTARRPVDIRLFTRCLEESDGAHLSSEGVAVVVHNTYRPALVQAVKALAAARLQPEEGGGLKFGQAWYWTTLLKWQIMALTGAEAPLRGHWTPRTERVGILPFLKQDDWGVMVGVGIDQGFFYYFFRARRDHTETGQWTRLAAPHHYSDAIPPGAVSERTTFGTTQGGVSPTNASKEAKRAQAKTRGAGWLKQVKEARITAATVSWSLRASAAIASLVGKLPLEASLRLRAESSAAFLAVGLRCFAQSFARYTLRHFTEREVVPNASVRQVLLHAAPEAEAALDLLQDAEHSLAVLGRQAAEAQGGGRNESEGAAARTGGGPQSPERVDVGRDEARDSVELYTVYGSHL